MSKEKTILDEKLLTQVSGGTNETQSIQVKCIICYTLMSVEKEDVVTLTILTTGGTPSAGEIEAAAKVWCTERNYKYVSYSVPAMNQYFVV